MILLPYCPRCGEKSLHWDGLKKWFCTLCHYTYYHNCAGATGVLLRHKDEILLSIRNREPAKGKLDLPGGFVDPSESAEECCKREIKEELGVSLFSEKFQYLGSQPNTYTYKDISYNTLDLFYAYELDNLPDFTLATDEISEVIWLKPRAINFTEIAFESQRKFLSNYIQSLDV